MTTTSPPLHDLVIRTVAEYLVGAGRNETLVDLQRVSTRFYGLRDIFIGQIALSDRTSIHAYIQKPYGCSHCVINPLAKY